MSGSLIIRRASVWHMVLNAISQVPVSWCTIVRLLWGHITSEAHCWAWLRWCRYCCRHCIPVAKLHIKLCTVHRCRHLNSWCWDLTKYHIKCIEVTWKTASYMWVKHANITGQTQVMWCATLSCITLSHQPTHHAWACITEWMVDKSHMWFTGLQCSDPNDLLVFIDILNTANTPTFLIHFLNKNVNLTLTKHWIVYPWHALYCWTHSVHRIC